MSLILDGVDLDALNYTVKVPYNGTIMTGGDSLHDDLNVFYDVSILRRAVHIRVEQKLI